MISAKRVSLTLIALAALILPATASAAAPGPVWSIRSVVRSPTVFVPGDSSGNALYNIEATNIGSQATNGDPITITDVLPPGLSVHPKPFAGSVEYPVILDEGAHETACAKGPPILCTVSTVVHPGERLLVAVPVDVASDAPPLVTNKVSVSGGGAPGASASEPTKVSSEPAPFGLQSFEAKLLDAGAAAETRAGSHPYQLRIGAQFNTILTGEEAPPAENPLDIQVDLPPGLVLNPLATPVRCTEVQFETTPPGHFTPSCPLSTAIGLIHFTVGIGGYVSPELTSPIFNLVPPPGSPAAFGFNAGGFGINIHLLGKVRSDGDYGLSSITEDIPQYASFSGTWVDLWGDPSDPSHDHRRGACAEASGFAFKDGCPVASTDTPLITMPSACSGPLDYAIRANSWQHRSSFVSASARSEDPNGNLAGVTGCDKLTYSPAIAAKPSTERAESGSGFDVDVDFPNNGLEEKSALAESNTEKAVVTLPQGVTINPSVGEGLGFCTPSQYQRESIETIDGEGCPADSKVGTLHLTSPLVDEALDGFVYLAQQDDPTTSTPGAENPFDTDIALYMILKNPILGVIVKQALKVVPDPKTGQLVATLEDIPQLPFSHFNFHFKEGARAALVTPAACGTYTTVAKFYPASDPDNPKTIASDFKIEQGVGGGPCPSGGIPPFHPGFQAGSVNNNAKSYSPFNMRLTRSDGEQDMTKFSSVLPPGVLGNLSGISKCPDAAIAAAKAKTGREEKASPSCPASSAIGHTLAGAGVGDSLTYVGGQLYMGGPYNGDPLSVIAITPALAGPFDAGTVVVREALTLNPVTAEVEVDGKASDPIPHILKGIVLKVRDLRVYVDKPNFILNPTSCDPSSAKATLFGAYLNVFDPSDDVPVNLSARYQAANCSSLGFKPKLAIDLKGGTKRGDHPALKAIVNARPGDANIGGAVVTLPKSAFLDQAHIRTICTRVQYAADNCPKAAQYGYARAFTPLLDEPVQGPVYLRSSSHKLPDLVAALHGIVDVDIVGRIDSFKGGIRSSFETVPDAPVSKFVLSMQGGKKGLVVNSRNLCLGKNRADARFTGQNGVPHDFKPVVRAKCPRRHPR